MNSTKKDNIKDALIRVINSYSPEYISQSEEASTHFYSLIDSIERFEDECEEDNKNEEDKQEWLDKEQGKH